MTTFDPIGMNSAGQPSILQPGDTITNTTSATTILVQKGSGTGFLADAVPGTDYVVSIPTPIQSSAARSIVTGTGATGFQISTTRNSNVSYTLQIVTTASIGSGAVGYVALEICSTNSATAANWIEVGRVTNGQVITLAIALNSVQTISSAVSGYVPSGYYAKLRSVNTTGTPTYSYISGQEVLI